MARAAVRGHKLLAEPAQPHDVPAQPDHRPEEPVARSRGRLTAAERSASEPVARSEAGPESGRQPIRKSKFDEGGPQRWQRRLGAEDATPLPKCPAQRMRSANTI